MVYFPIVIFYIFFGIGAGIRYLYFRLIGKRRKYETIIAPNLQSLWNFLLSFLIIAVILFLVYQCSVRTIKRDDVPIEVLMNKKY